MNFIKSFHILIALFAVLAYSDLILNDYGNGNKGVGVNDQVNGKNNTWIGDTNRINGNVNKVIGNQNQINGSNNYVEGSGNVIGEVTPQQLLQLQNQMFSSLQDRFKGVFSFSSPNQITQQSSLTEHQSSSSSQSHNIVAQKNHAIPQKVQNQTHQNKIIQKAQRSSKVDENTPPKSNSRQFQDLSMLVFRSYGKLFHQLSHEDIFDLQAEGRHESAHQILCQRWNYCLDLNRDQSWFFTSVYPSFPNEIDL